MSFMDPIYQKIGEAICHPEDGKYNKAIGVAEVAIGTSFASLGKLIHKKQGFSGRLMNKFMGCDPISDAIEDCEYIANEGKRRLKGR